MAFEPISLTFNDLVKRLDGSNQTIAHIIEVLQKNNPVLQDVKWMESNNLTGNVTTLRTSLPKASFRRVNQGVKAAKSTTRQVTDTITSLEAHSDVDLKLLKRSPNPQSLRLSEDDAFVEGISQQVAEMFFYGDSDVTPDEFNGFAKRYASYGGKEGDYSHQVVNAGGTTDNGQSSVWFVSWGDQACVGLYPKNGTYGLNHEDKGEVELHDENGGTYYGMRSLFTWDVGLAVQNPRLVAAVRNIDLKKINAGTAADKKALVDAFVDAEQLMQRMDNVVMYCSKGVLGFLKKYLLDKNNVYVTRQDVLNAAPAMYFDGIPVHASDGLKDTEEVITEAK